MPAFWMRRFGRPLAWAGSAGLHAAAGAMLLLGLPETPPGPFPVTLLEMQAPEPPAQQVAELPAQAEEAPEPPEAPVPVAEALPPEPSSTEPPETDPVPAELVSNSVPPSPPQRPTAAPRRQAPLRTATAPAQPAAPAASSPALPVVAAAPPPSYVAQIFAALERHKSYPMEARYRRAQGVAMLRFRMRRDGTVTGYRLERSTGDAALDDAVLVMIERASPLPAPPAGLSGDSIELTVPVRFALR